MLQNALPLPNLDEDTFIPERTGPHPLGLYYAYAQQYAAMGQCNMEAFLRGVKAYQSSEQPLLDPIHTHNYEAVKKFGRATLWRCRPQKHTQNPALHLVKEQEEPSQTAARPPFLLVPSFINTADILDVHPRLGLVAVLEAAGYDVHLLTWGKPQVEEPLTLTASIMEMLLPAIQHFNQPIHMLGYCVGGTIAAAAAQLVPESIKKLILAAAPWDFTKTFAHQSTQGAAAFVNWKAVFEHVALLPADVVQSGFVQMDIQAALKRICQHGEPMKESDRSRLIALEDWLSKPIPLDKTIAESLFVDWHMENKPFKGEWVLDGQVIAPKKLTMPTLVIQTERDHLVPAESSAPLLEAPKAESLHVTSGHVGLMVGRAAVPQFFTPMLQWLAAE